MCDALSNTKLFSSAQGNRPKPSVTQGLQCDAPDHTIRRNLLQNAFPRSLIDTVRATTTEKATHLLANLRVRAHWDLHDDYALPLSIRVLGRLLGVPEAELELFQYYTETHAAANLTQDPDDRPDHWACLLYTSDAADE